MPISRAIAAAALLLSPAALHATTVVAPTFKQLVRQAEVIFEGEVSDIRSRAIVEGGSEKIVTDVTFRVVKVLKGTTPPQTTLRFAGGVVGDQGYAVAGVPTFVRGERDVLFAIASKPLISPLVGVMYGRFRIVTDGPAQQEVVRQHDGTPLRTIASIGSTAKQPVFSQKPAMPLSAFETEIAAEIRRQARARRKP